MSQDDRHEELLFPDNCPAIYFNGFAMAIATGDVVIALQLNGKPTMVMNTSYTVAKSLAESLSKVIGELEQKTGTTIMTVQTVAASIAKGPNQGMS